MSRKTKEEAQRTRRSIMRAAEKLFYRQGVVSTSLQEIAEAAGVTRGAVYWHFRDKAELLQAIADDVFLLHEDMLDRLSAMDLDDPVESLRKTCFESLDAIVSDRSRRRVFTILTQRCEYLEEMNALIARNQVCRDKVCQRLTGLLRQAKQKGHLRVTWSPEAAATALQSMVFGFIISEMEWERPSPARNAARSAAINGFFASLRN